MLDWATFEEMARVALKRDISPANNQDQHDAIAASLGVSLFIVAGPGSGKTTVLALKVLKLIYVDGLDPATILATTFTNKAAAELRSRILGWGDLLRKEILKTSRLKPMHAWAEALDINRVITGTLDSIAEEVLTNYRGAGEAAPVIIEEFVASALMLRGGLFQKGRFRDDDLKEYAKALNGDPRGVNVAGLSGLLRTLKDRYHFDQVDVSQYLKKTKHVGAPVAAEVIHDYEQELAGRLVLDFAHVELQVLQQLTSGKLNDWIAPIRCILVDEYQDTNLLQEQIYFHIAAAALKQGGSLTVVGDDDQSLYRFRGATVDLFQNFRARLKDALKTTAQTIYLRHNYRSTGKIVDFCNAYVALDATYQRTRVRGKPPIQASRPGTIEFPVLGLFRPSPEQLAEELARFIRSVTDGTGYKFTDAQRKRHTIKVNASGGNAGDIVLLSGSPREYSNGGKIRLPRLLRDELAAGPRPIQIFNPRGQELRSVHEVEILCGLTLECMDPGGTIQATMTRVSPDTHGTLNAWRQAAQAYIATNPTPKGLKAFVAAWATRKHLKSGKPFDDQVRISLIDLMYKLVTWIPSMQSDIEGLVYLESITGTVTRSALFSSFEGELVIDATNKGLETASITDAYWTTFVPLATGAVDINEDLLETLPRDRVNIMSIHQSKGLEFPLVVVDVGSDFDKALPVQAFKRFPHQASPPCLIEDEFRPFSPLGAPTRSALDRSFDDLVRQYFVSFSRPQDVLLLVGLSNVKDGYQVKTGKDRDRVIQNVGTGWTRDQVWRWGQGLPNLVHI